MQKLWTRDNIKKIIKKAFLLLLNVFIILFWIVSMPIAFAYFTWLHLGEIWEVAFLTAYFWGGFWLVSWHHVIVLSKVLGKNLKEI